MQAANHPPPRAPWRDMFEKHLAEMPAPEFTLGTALHDKGIAYPHVRTCIFRSFWAELKLRDSAREELQKQGQASREAGDGTASKDFEPNPTLYESDMLSFTTDVRMDKAEQIMSCQGDDHDGGGEVECVFWVKPVSTQWRLKGRAYVVGGNKEDARENIRRDSIFRWMRARPTDDASPIGETAKSWSWDKEITAHFANMSPIMRGSFKNPPPGTPRSSIPTDPSLKLGQKVYDLHDPVARSNFRVVVIQPTEAEFLDLTDPENGKRVSWTLTGDGGPENNGQWLWEEEELWP